MLVHALASPTERGHKRRGPRNRIELLDEALDGGLEG